jgi:hypothetical protein
MNYRRLELGLLMGVIVLSLIACQSRTKPAEQQTNLRPDTTVFDDDTLEGAISDSLRPKNIKN